MYNRTFVIGDIHGGYMALVQLIEKLQITDQDRLIFLGDYVDGWSQSFEVVQYLISLKEKVKCIFIRGNHDAWIQKWLESGHRSDKWLSKGGALTVQAYDQKSSDVKEQHLAFFQSMKNYYKDKKNRLFIHAGFTSMKGPKNKKRSRKNYFEDRTLWEMAWALKDHNPDVENYPYRLRLFNEIFIGHTPTTRFNSSVPIHVQNLWNMDTGAAFTGPLTAMEVNTKEIIQTDPVQSFYPGEKGKNP